MPDNGKTGSASKSSSKFATPGLNIGLLTVTSQRAFEHWARGMARLYHDMAEFVQSRLLEDAATWEKLATCHDPAAALDLQRRYAAKASTDYTAASQKFSRLILEIGHSCSSDLRQTPPETD